MEDANVIVRLSEDQRAQIYSIQRTRLEGTTFGAKMRILKIQYRWVSQGPSYQLELTGTKNQVNTALRIILSRTQGDIYLRQVW